METLELTASIVWKAIQLGNVNVLKEKERDRLMALRSNYGLTGPLTTCDATPMSSNFESFSNSDKIEITEQQIKEITERVIKKLNQ
jgi:L-fuculose-phosphate aldolase